MSASEVQDQEPAEQPEPEIDALSTTVEVADDEPEAPSPKDDKATRKQRRAEWMEAQKRGAQESADLRRQLDTERVERQRLAESLAEIRGRLSTQTQVDPMETKLQGLREKAERHLQASATTQDQALAKRELKSYHDALEEIADARAERRMAQDRQERNQNQPDPAAMRTAGRLESEFPWVADNAPARAVADAFINQMIGEGHPDNYATYKAGCAKAAEVLRLGGTPVRANGDGRRYTLPTGQRGGTGGPSGTLTLNEHQMKMAELLYPDLESEAAHKKWANGPGRKVLEAQEK